VTAEGFTARNKRIAKDTAGGEVDRLGHITQDQGFLPWEGPKQTEAEKMAEYETVRSDPAALAEFHAAYQRKYHLAPDRVSKRFRRELQTMERRRARGEVTERAGYHVMPDGAVMPDAEMQG